MNDLLSTLAIRKCHVIQAPTDQPEISYNVIMSKSFKTAKNLLVDAVKKQLKTCSPMFCSLVYCQGKKSVEEIARLIGCNPFHVDRLEDEWEVSFTNWVTGKDKFLVSTSLLGCGIDIEGVEVVYHFLTPWSCYST